MPFHSTTIFTLAHLLPLSHAHLPQQKTPFKLAILYNNSIVNAHPSFLLEEAILFCNELQATRATCPMKSADLFLKRYLTHWTGFVTKLLYWQLTLWWQAAEVLYEWFHQHILSNTLLTLDTYIKLYVLVLIKVSRDNKVLLNKGVHVTPVYKMYNCHFSVETYKISLQLDQIWWAKPETQS